MKKTMYALIAIFVLLGVVVGIKYGDARKELKSDAPLSTRDSEVPGDGVTAPFDSGVEKAASVANMPEPLSSENRINEYLCRSKSECPAIASAVSSDEAKWLASRGYPSGQRLKELQNMPLSQLERLGDGDLVAATVYGEQLIKSDQFERGMEQLHMAYARGSTFAAYKMAEAYKTKDLSESAAYYRLAYLDGDWKAPAELFESRPDITLAELNSADERALVLYGRAMERRAKNRLPMRLGVRPFAD